MTKENIAKQAQKYENKNEKDGKLETFETGMKNEMK